ncbi:hypothetical protein TRFO_42713 [Tritrichomonas foetus]|uniref:Uncharacterized protein n=1 Tax=Tritrichomonas foetus TaxID=1144522 RepID=A0A1J4KZC5_9EUKA|nr:hypothetical protein TRFO_42713 [Tritrichomonas foetus]|eukprot:OHT15062.1 hypothetical protein TRFO_42713 [Tritrichomonas foetus]
MNWRKGIRLIIHIADAPAHGNSYCNEFMHNEEGSKLDPLIQSCSSSEIKIIGMPIGSYPMKSYIRCQELYNTSRGPNSMYRINLFSQGSSDLSRYFKDTIVRAAISAAPQGQ